MITITTTYTGELRTTSTHKPSGSTVITDAPTDNNGKGEAFSPTDLACTALVTCMLTIMGIYAQKNDFELGEVNAEVEKVMAVSPRKIAAVNIQLHFRQSFDAAVQERLKDAALHCPVALSLHPDIRQQVVFNFS